MNYKGNQHLKWEDRLSLERMLKIKTPKPKIAEALGVCLKATPHKTEDTRKRM